MLDRLLPGISITKALYILRVYQNRTETVQDGITYHGTDAFFTGLIDEIEDEFVHGLLRSPLRGGSFNFLQICHGNVLLFVRMLRCVRTFRNYVFIVDVKRSLLSPSLAVWAQATLVGS